MHLSRIAAVFCMVLVNTPMSPREVPLIATVVPMYVNVAVDESQVENEWERNDPTEIIRTFCIFVELDKDVNAIESFENI